MSRITCQHQFAGTCLCKKSLQPERATNGQKFMDPVASRDVLEERLGMFLKSSQLKKFGLCGTWVELVLEDLTSEILLPTPHHVFVKAYKQAAAKKIGTIVA
eukprot:4943489-Amphidinium_carterae.1